MDWYVYRQNATGDIEWYNIFDHYGFVHDLAKAARSCGSDLGPFEDALNESGMYYFSHRCEWEIILAPCPMEASMKHNEKINVYDQLNLNYIPFLSYCWNNRDELIRMDAKRIKKLKAKKKGHP